MNTPYKPVAAHFFKAPENERITLLSYDNREVGATLHRLWYEHNRYQCALIELDSAKGEWIKASMDSHAGSLNRPLQISEPQNFFELDYTPRVDTI